MLATIYGLYLRWITRNSGIFKPGKLYIFHRYWEQPSYSAPLKLVGYFVMLLILSPYYFLKIIFLPVDFKLAAKFLLLLWESCLLSRFWEWEVPLYDSASWERLKNLCVFQIATYLSMLWELQKPYGLWEKKVPLYDLLIPY